MLSKKKGQRYFSKHRTLKSGFKGIGFEIVIKT